MQWRGFCHVSRQTWPKYLASILCKTQRGWKHLAVSILLRLRTQQDTIYFILHESHKTACWSIQKDLVLPFAKENRFIWKRARRSCLSLKVTARLWSAWPCQIWTCLAHNHVSINRFCTCLIFMWSYCDHCALSYHSPSSLTVINLDIESKPALWQLQLRPAAPFCRWPQPPSRCALWARGIVARAKPRKSGTSKTFQTFEATLYNDHPIILQLN